MFKPTKTETPKSESFNGGNGAIDEDRIAPPADPEKSLFRPVEVETPKSESFNENAKGTGQPGDGLPPGSLPYDLHATQAQEQSVKDDRGTVTVFVSDLPQK